MMNGENAVKAVLSAKELYDKVDFISSDSFYNIEAPKPVISLFIGAVLSVISMSMWLQRVFRVIDTVHNQKKNAHLDKVDFFRAMISCAIKNDCPTYTTVTYSAIHFICLGGLQTNFQKSYIVMIGFCCLISCAETLGILLTYVKFDTFLDVRKNCALYNIEHVRQMIKVEDISNIFPCNVYEDLSRNKTVIIMVFLTQCCLIFFVVLDAYQNPTVTCIDGSTGCPVVGTLGSWMFYVLGIFLGCVYLIGPSSSFGESPHDPRYWKQLLIGLKQAGSKLVWEDPTDSTQRQSTDYDLRMWVQFTMSYLINGAGFYLVVYTLPIQVASSSSLFVVVYRALGMMYVIDLDDTDGRKLTIVNENPPGGNKSEQKQSNKHISFEIDEPDSSQIASEAQKIINQARAKLDLLESEGPIRSNERHQYKRRSLTSARRSSKYAM